MLNQHFKFGDINPSHYFFIFGLFLVIIFASTGNEDGTMLNPLILFLQWFLNVFVPISILISLHISLQSVTRFDRLNPWIKLILTGLVGAVIFAPIAYLLDITLGTDAKPINSEAWAHGLIEEFGNIILPIIASWVAMNAPWVLGFRFRNFNADFENTPKMKQSHELISEIHGHVASMEIKPISLFDIPINQIIYLKAEQHYLRVITMTKSKLFLFNLKDAISELPEHLGIQTHRSYWVAFEYIEKIQSHDDQKMLLMKNNALVPISRRNQSKVKMIIKQYCF
jgi:hypothetical protein